MRKPGLTGCFALANNVVLPAKGLAPGGPDRLGSSPSAGTHRLSMPRRKIFHLALGGAALVAAPRIARGQTYPARPVRVIVGFPAGSSPDITARLVGQWLTERLGQQFIVDNRPGAGSNVATEAAVRAAPDGYTLLWVTSANAIGVTLYDNLNFDFIRDLAPVAGIIRVPNVMEVNPSVPVDTVPGFIAYAKAHPATINMGSGGIGTTPHLAGELFKMMTGINMLHVPYRGSPQATTDLIAGRVQVMFDVMPQSIAHVRARELRALAVTTGVRSAALPDVPTVSEFVPGYEASSWHGIAAPAKTPREIVDTLNKEIGAALADARLEARLADLGGAVLPGSPADFHKLVSEEIEKWAKVVKFVGLKPA
jgi:tripartite-type tricarboxylate transporter receptor subunit TctC